MDDLVVRLRRMNDELDDEAADELERLRAALEGITKQGHVRHPDDTHVKVYMPVKLFKEFL